MGINFQDVVFRYNKKNSKNTLDHVNFSIKNTNEFITILGHTGSGKSTLVQHMNALLLPESGHIEVFGKSLLPKKNTGLKEVRRRVGLVFQFPEYQLFEETVLKDVMFGPKNFGKTKEEALNLAKEACRVVGISEELWERSPFNLSGGQMRRVAIAGILASNPDILILDEPTVGLDPKGRLEILNLLRKIQEETHKSIILITHDMSVVASVSKRVLVMKDGKLVADTTPRKLFSNEQQLHEFNLELPESARLAKELKKTGLIEFDSLPITKEELKNVILGKKWGDFNE